MGLEKFPNNELPNGISESNQVTVSTYEMYAAATNRVFHLLLSCIENPI